MEVKSFLVSPLQNHYKKLLILCTATAAIYLIKRYFDKRRRALVKKEKKKIKEFPTIEEIQRFIEDLPFDAVASGKAVTLKDLLGELSEFSEDEEWRELIASVHGMYDNKDNIEETGSIMSIYEDSNVIAFGTTPREGPAILEIMEESGNESNKGRGDTETLAEKIENGDVGALSKNVGEGDKGEPV